MDRIFQTTYDKNFCSLNSTKILFYSYQSWWHGPLWYFYALVAKYGEVNIPLFFSNSIKKAKNLWFIEKLPCLTKFYWAQKHNCMSWKQKGAPHDVISINTNRRECSVQVLGLTYRKVASTNMRYWLKEKLFVKRSQYISIENPLHKRFEKACMCFYTRRASTCDYTVFDIN